MSNGMKTPVGQKDLLHLNEKPKSSSGALDG